MLLVLNQLCRHADALYINPHLRVLNFDSPAFPRLFYPSRLFHPSPHPHPHIPTPAYTPWDFLYHRYKQSTKKKKAKEFFEFYILHTITFKCSLCSIVYFNSISSDGLALLCFFPHFDNCMLTSLRKQTYMIGSANELRKPTWNTTFVNHFSLAGV